MRIIILPLFQNVVHIRFFIIQNISMFDQVYNFFFNIHNTKREYLSKNIVLNFLQSALLFVSKKLNLIFLFSDLIGM